MSALNIGYILYLQMLLLEKIATTPTKKKQVLSYLIMLIQIYLSQIYNNIYIFKFEKKTKTKKTKL